MYSPSADGGLVDMRGTLTCFAGSTKMPLEEFLPLTLEMERDYETQRQTGLHQTGWKNSGATKVKPPVFDSCNHWIDGVNKAD